MRHEHNRGTGVDGSTNSWQCGTNPCIARNFPVNDGYIQILTNQDALVLQVEVDEALRPYVVAKGCIALDGISLTVGSRVEAGRFEVFLIPYTWEHTTLHERHPGDEINVETDVLARYVVHLLQGRRGPQSEGITWDQLESAFGRTEA